MQRRLFRDDIPPRLKAIPAVRHTRTRSQWSKVLPLSDAEENHWQSNHKQDTVVHQKVQAPARQVQCVKPNGTVGDGYASAKSNVPLSNLSSQAVLTDINFPQQQGSAGAQGPPSLGLSQP